MLLNDAIAMRTKEGRELASWRELAQAKVLLESTVADLAATRALILTEMSQRSPGSKPTLPIDPNIEWKTS